MGGHSFVALGMLRYGTHRPESTRSLALCGRVPERHGAGQRKQFRDTYVSSRYHALVESETMSAARKSALHETEAELVVERRDDVADGVVALTFAHPTGDELPAWTPGAHVDLLLDDGLVRQYSLCSSPADRGSWRIGVLLAPDTRGGSKHVHEKLVAGERVRVRGPRNHFPLVAAPRYQFIAGGIGITPFISMIRRVNALGRSWELHYGARSRAHGRPRGWQ